MTNRSRGEPPISLRSSEVVAGNIISAWRAVAVPPRLVHDDRLRTLRGRRPVIAIRLRYSGQRHAFDLDLVAADQLDPAHRTGGRISGEEFAIDRVHVLIL